jgi:hypothetical protein
MSKENPTPEELAEFERFCKIREAKYDIMTTQCAAAVKEYAEDYDGLDIKLTENSDKALKNNITVALMRMMNTLHEIGFRVPDPSIPDIKKHPRLYSNLRTSFFEALHRARALDCPVRRKTWDQNKHLMYGDKRTDNSEWPVHTMVVVTTDDSGASYSYEEWQPTQEDIFADDWVVRIDCDDFDRCINYFSRGIKDDSIYTYYIDARKAD